MSSDLDTRLRALPELAPPSRGPLGAEELHRRATKRRQRAVALRAVPVAVVVIAVLAGAFARQGRSTTTDVLVGPPEVTQVPDASSISERDLQVIGFLRTVAELRHQVDREMVLSAAYDGANGRAELDAQRAATDVALQAYDEGADAVVAGGASPVDDQGLVEAITQANNRLERIETIRRSVDAVQTDALGRIDPYANTAMALQDISVGYLQQVDDPDVFRGVLTASNFGTYATTKADSVAILTISVEAGFYAGILPRAADPTVGKGDCGEDPSGAGNACPTFDDASDRNVDSDRLEATFLTFATAEQKQMFRAADAGSDFDELLASTFEDGIGINDLRGIVPGSEAIDPAVWRTAALNRLDRLAVVEQQLYEMATSGAVDPPTDSGATGSSPGTPPSTSR